MDTKQNPIKNNVKSYENHASHPFADFVMFLNQKYIKIFGHLGHHCYHHMKTGPYIIAGFAPAQKTVRTRSGRGWHTSGGVAILVREGQTYPATGIELGSGQDQAA